MIRMALALVIVLLRKVRRAFGFPVLDLDDAKGPVRTTVREMERKPKAEQQDHHGSEP